MNLEQFRKALFPDGEVPDLTIGQIARRVGRPAKQDLFDMVGVVDGEVVSMSYPLDEGTAFLTGIKGFVRNEHVLFNVKVNLKPADDEADHDPPPSG